MISEKVLVVLLFSSVQIIAQDDDTIVHLDKGRIRGRLRKSENGMDYYAFQEIPYAAPPVGSDRFQLPREPDAWNGILNTTRNTKICYQQNSRHDYLEISEDCLYINVYSPIKPGSVDLLPVLLWIHGGGLISESGVYEYYGPKYIMDHGVVVVSFDYRLGPFGFMGTDDGVIPLNIGLKDQRFAIEWVSKNIHLFGGNPKQITLVGESAGSISVGYHLISQKPDEDLFHAVIMQSGSTLGIMKQDYPAVSAFNLGNALDRTFTSTNSSELLKFLQSARASDILATGITGSVTVENEGLFSYLGYQAFLDKEYKKVPVLLGFNSEEWLFLVYSKNETQMKEIDEDPSALILDRINIAPENRSLVGSLLKDVYVGNDSFQNCYGCFIRFNTDQLFTTGMSRQVELSSDDAPYYFYQFAYKGELGGFMDLIPPPGAERVVHAEDLHYMWDDTTNTDLTKFPEADQLMLHRYVKMWTNFVKYFNPTPEPDPLLGNFEWLRSEPQTLRYLNMNVTFEMREHPRQYQQIKDILLEYSQPPFDSFS